MRTEQILKYQFTNLSFDGTRNKTVRLLPPHDTVLGHQDPADNLQFNSINRHLSRKPELKRRRRCRAIISFLLFRLPLCPGSVYRL